MENEETEFEDINTNTSNSSSNTENSTNTENSVNSNTTATEVVITLDESQQLAQIHDDLGFICCFIIFFVIVILCKYAYKFFDMFFSI